MGLVARIFALMGISAYQPAPRSLVSLDSPQVLAIREAQGGQLQPIPYSQTRWYLADAEAAEQAADAGNLTLAARLMRSARKDGVYSGVLSTATDGLVRLPKRFVGRTDIVAALEVGGEEARSVFDEMCPASELAALAADGIELGVGIAELVPVEGRDYPVLVRMDPEFLSYRWNEGRWYFRSNAGPILVTPGDGRWVLHCPGARIAPWQRGHWRAIGRAYIRKDHANLAKDNWERVLANPARVATSPAGASEGERAGWFERVAAWGRNTVFSMIAGYDVKLLESNGKGFESFVATIADQNNEFVMTIAGQTVTTTGGTGFSNQDVHKAIRADIIKSIADALAHTVNTQIFPSWIWARFGEDALVGAGGAILEWDVTPPKDRNIEALALGATATAIKGLTEALAPHGIELDVAAICEKFGVPVIRKLDTETEDAEIVPAPTAAEPTIADVKSAIDLARGAGLQPTESSLRLVASRVGLDLEPIPVGTSQPKSINLAPTDIAKVVTANEARSSQGLPPFADDRGDKTITQLDAVAVDTPAAPAQEAA